MKYIILLLLVTACSSSKVTTKIDTPRKHYKNPTDRYFQKKLSGKRTQLVYIYKKWKKKQISVQ